MNESKARADLTKAARCLLSKHLATLETELTCKRRVQYEKYAALAMTKVLCEHNRLTCTRTSMGRFNVRCADCKLSVPVKD